MTIPVFATEVATGVLKTLLKRDSNTGGGLQLYLKKKLWCMCFPVNIEKFLRTNFLQDTSRRLLLSIESQK